jgi:hypothetical protein
MDDLNKYQIAWKTEKSFQEEKLSETEIQGFMKSTSKVVGQYKRSIVFDILFKVILIVSFLILLYLLQNQSTALYSIPIFILIAIVGVILQIKMKQIIESISNSNKHLKNFLNSQIDFYKGQYIKSILVSALSGSLFFLSGSLFYLQFQTNNFQVGQFEIYFALVEHTN